MQNTFSGERPHRLRKSDLPVVARAIVAAVRRQGGARVIDAQRNMPPYVQLTGRDYSISVLLEDWQKILPYIQDSSFDPVLVPANSKTVSSDSVDQYDPSSLDTADRLFYERVLYILQGLFLEDYPTSNM